MKITLSNGAELEPIVVTGGKKHVQGATRDALNFVFPSESSLDALDTLFSEENCEQIIIIQTNETEEENQYIYTGYTVRAELKREPVLVSPATETTAEIVEQRVTVSMAQRTYQESLLAQSVREVRAQEEINAAQDEALIELYELMGV